jgi:hypothetical protein
MVVVASAYYFILVWSAPAPPLITEEVGHWRDTSRFTGTDRGNDHSVRCVAGQPFDEGTVAPSRN